jgi:Flp pilus assembly protein TadG
MLNRSPRRGHRPAAALVECAFVYPLTFLLLIGLVVTAQGVARYQEVAALARAGARYASTHGAQSRKDAGLAVGSPGTLLSSPGSSGTSGAGTGVVAGSSLFWYSTDPTKDSGTDTSWTGDAYDSAVRPKLVALDPSRLTFKVGYPSVVNQSTKPDNWPGSQVTVTVTYQWLPDLYLVGPIPLSSTSSLPITN